MMMLQLMIFALFFLVFGIIAVIRKRRLVGWSFVLMGIMLMTVSLIVVTIHPNTSPLHLFQ